MENLFSMEKLFHGNYLNRYFQYINWIHYLLKIKITFFSLFFHALLLGSEQISIDGDVEIVSDFSSRTCPDVVDSCIYICSDGDTNPCHPSEIITISVDTIPGIEDSDGSRYRIYFPWEHGGMNASKFRVTASWPCLSPTPVAAAGNYAFWDVIGNDACPGTVEGSIWYGDDCQDESGNIGSEDCIELIGRFCFAPGDTLDWPDESDQSIANDYCDACWMSAPAWGQYDTYEYSDSLLSPGSCSAFDHCHHSTSDNILCGVGYLDDNFVSVTKDKQRLVPQILNYPNPFNPYTYIYYSLFEDAKVEIDIYNVMGKKIIDLVSGWQSKGEKFARWEAVDSRGIPLAGGVYIYTIQIGKYRETKKMIFLK